MDLDSGLHIRRQGNILIAWSWNTGWWLGALFAGFAGLLLMGWIASSTSDVPRWGGLFFLVFIGFGVYQMLPRTVTTTFDLGDRRILRTLSFCHGLYVRKRACAFAEVTGIGLKESYNEGYSYRPIITLRDGGVLTLSASSGGSLIYEDALQTICAETGLPRRNIRKANSDWPN